MEQNQTHDEDWVKDGKFDYLVIGSGLCESMVAYLLSASESSPTVLQVDPNSFYGQSWAAVQLDQLEATSSMSSSTPQPPLIQEINTSKSTSNYALSLQPTLVPARGKFVDALISSKVAPYLSFQLLHAFILAQPNGTLLPLPGSKHDLFRMSDLSLVEKRLLMRFFQLIIQPDDSIIPNPGQSLSEYLSQPPFSISNPRLASMIASLSLSPTSNPTARGVYERLRTVLSAIGRHPSPTISALPAAVLLGEYGGGGDWTEGFVRAAAVTGRAVQVIGRPILSLEKPSEHRPVWSIRLGSQIGHSFPAEGAEDPLEFSARRLLISQQYFSSLIKPDSITPRAYTMLRGLAIVTQPGLLDKLNGSAEGNQNHPSRPSNSHALVVFPPEVAPCESPVHVLVVGSDSGSCPENEQAIYLTTSIVRKDGDGLPDPSEVLQPILEKIIDSGASTPSQDTLKRVKYYSQSVYHLPAPSQIPPNVSVIPAWPVDIEQSSYLEVVESLVAEAQKLSHIASL